MSTKSFDKSQTSDVDVNRRNFLKKSGVAIAAGVALSPFSTFAASGNNQNSDVEQESTIDEASRQPRMRPNFVILITDQERFPQNWPDDWADLNLPNRKRLSNHGLTFTHAFCGSSMCSPSRATLFTGLYPAKHGVEQTLQTGDEDSLSQSTLHPGTQNIAKMLLTAGYDVQYRGKWHISKDPSGTLDIQSQSQLARYGFQGWHPPDGGQDQNPAHFGGGDTNYDAQYAAQAAEFLRTAKPRSSVPFALFVCLINPHDIMSYPGVAPPNGPGGWDHLSFSDIPPFQGSDNYRKDYPACFDFPEIGLPETFTENPDSNFKPKAQAQSTSFWSKPNVLGPLDSDNDRNNYVRFYAYLHKESDKHIGTVLDALESNPFLYHNTIVFRMADHGEMGLSHGGMRQKAYNAYEETIHVPLVISNPKLFPRPVQTRALTSLVDVMPTLATIANVPDRDIWMFQGHDLTPIIQDAIDHPRNPTRTIQESILFTTDEVIGSVEQPSHIRCLREARWKVALYFDPTGEQPSQFELYDLTHDPLELHNMAAPANVAYFNPAKLEEMIGKLQRKMAETGTGQLSSTGEYSRSSLNGVVPDSDFASTIMRAVTASVETTSQG